MTKPSREVLIENLVSLSPMDPDVALNRRAFLPTAAHRRALSPEVVVIRGARGAGKTALFRLASGEKDIERLRSFFEDPRLPEARWIDAFSVGGMAHPEVGVLQTSAGAASDVALRAFWMTHLLRRVREDTSLPEAMPEGVQKLLALPSADVARWLPEAERELGAVSAALDDVERALSKDGRWLYAAYDGLDLLGPFDHEVRRRYISALLSLWLSLSARYQRLRGKVFLREDLFDPAQLAFVDAGKLRARSESLEWHGETLFRLLVRDLADKSEEARALLASVAGLTLEDRGEEGWMPGAMNDAVQSAFALAVAPRTLGKGVLKSDTPSWILSRLQDSQKRITPRAFLWFFSFAAEGAKAAKRSAGPLLVDEDLLGALKRTSKERANEIQEEYPVTRRMESLRGLRLPITHADAVARLQNPAPNEIATRAAKGDLVVDELVRVGVLRPMPDGRLDVPDIFRYYFEIGPDYAAAWKDLVERDDPIALANLQRDLPDLAAIPRAAGVSLEWPSFEKDMTEKRFSLAKGKIEASLDLALRSENREAEGALRLALGRVLLEERALDDAAEELERAEALLSSPRRKEFAALHRGRVAFFAGQLPKARQFFERVRQNARGDAEWLDVAATVWLARVESEQGANEAAHVLLLSVRARGANNGELTGVVFAEFAELAKRKGAPNQAMQLAILSRIADPDRRFRDPVQSPVDYERLHAELEAAYRSDRGWSVLREAFPELPEVDPAAPAPKRKR